MPFRLVLLWLLCCLHWLPAGAQLCQGPESDPVAVIDFGSEAAPYAVSGKLGSLYAGTNEACTPEGSLALRSIAFMCKPEWQVTPFDHTDGDQNGNFLMVSALPGNTEVYRDTITGLCPASVFNYKMWVLNLVVASACNGLASDPKLKVEIKDGTGAPLAELNTGFIEKPARAEWQSFGLQFRSPASGTVIIVVHSLEAKVCGSDFGIDDITLAPCKGGITASLQGGNGFSVQVCQDQQQSLLIRGNYNGFTNPRAQWQVSENGNRWLDVPGANGAAFSRLPSDAGDYAYRLRLTENGNAACSFVSNPVQVQVFRKPFAQGTNYVYGCYGFPVNFQASGGTQYEWTGPAGFRSNSATPQIPKVDFANAGKYIVKVRNAVGCTAFDSTDLVVYDAPKARLNIRDTVLCAGDSIQLVAGGAENYLWLPAGGLSNNAIAAPFAKPEADARYTVRVYDDFTCYDTATVFIRVVKRPFVDAGPDKYAFRNRPVLLEGRVSGEGVRYKWTPAALVDKPGIQRPMAKITQTTTFILEAESNSSCGNVADSVKVSLIDGLFIPTAFSPNGDRLNDVWELFALPDYPNSVVRVFDRWGSEVYQSTGRTYQPWNGKRKGVPVVPGIYIYTLNLGDGSPLRKGTLTVLQ